MFCRVLSTALLVYVGYQKSFLIFYLFIDLVKPSDTLFLDRMKPMPERSWHLNVSRSAAM